jgi:pyruvate/2-oxoglutarate dehydrogenase complex dihydrolipoamide acyltransferase (E2) component
MVNEITARRSFDLAVNDEDFADELAGRLAKSQSSSPQFGGTPLLRMMKSGEWIFGQADEPVQVGSEWAINPKSLAHGYACWSDNPGNQKNVLLGEVMVSVFADKPAQPADINGFPFAEQRSFDLKCLNGDDEGKQVFYKNTSKGGMRAVDNLFTALQVQRTKNPKYMVPIVQLKSTSYKHPTYGQTYTPVFDIVAWSNMAGEEMPDPAAAAPAAAAPAEAPAEAPKPAPRAAPVAEPARPAAPRRQRPVQRPVEV